MCVCVADWRTDILREVQSRHMYVVLRGLFVTVMHFSVTVEQLGVEGKTIEYITSL